MSSRLSFYTNRFFVLIDVIFIRTPTLVPSVVPTILENPTVSPIKYSKSEGELYWMHQNQNKAVFQAAMNRFRVVHELGCLRIIVCSEFFVAVISITS
jgi:hypothetical protein